MRKKTAPVEDKGLAGNVMEALRLCDQMNADGVSKVDRDTYLEGVIRATWPVTRLWKYRCEDCADTGWLHRVCTTQHPCGRPFRLPKGTNRSGLEDVTGQGTCTPNHAYVQPCVCAKGESQRQALLGLHENDPLETAGAGRAKGRGGWSRAGRR